MTLTYQEKIISLWVVFLLGLLFHTQLGLMPLFYGQSVTIADTHQAGSPSYILWGMLAFFIFPMIAIVATIFTDAKRYRLVHFGVTVAYTIVNLLHVILDLMVKPIAWYQIALMLVLFAVGILLNWVSYQWMHAYHPRGKRILT